MSSVGRKKIYEEDKKRFTMTLTQTALDWLEQKRIEMNLTSASDVIEQLARKKATQTE